MAGHIRYVVHLVGTDQYLLHPNFYHTQSFELAKLYARKQDADKLERRWNAKRISASARYAQITKDWPAAEVVAVDCVLRVVKP